MRAFFSPQVPIVCLLSGLLAPYCAFGQSSNPSPCLRRFMCMASRVTSHQCPAPHLERYYKATLGYWRSQRFDFRVRLMSLLPTTDLTCPLKTGRLQAHSVCQHEMRKSYIGTRVILFETKALRSQHVAVTMGLDPHRLSGQVNVCSPLQINM